METFVHGDRAMAECADAVQQRLPVCRAMASLAADASKYRRISRAGIRVCTNCEKVWRDHAEHRKEREDRADACAAGITERRKRVA